MSRIEMSKKITNFFPWTEQKLIFVDPSAENIGGNRHNNWFHRHRHFERLRKKSHVRFYKKKLIHFASLRNEFREYLCGLHAQKINFRCHILSKILGVFSWLQTMWEPAVHINSFIKVRTKEAVYKGSKSSSKGPRNVIVYLSGRDEVANWPEPHAVNVWACRCVDDA